MRSGRKGRAGFILDGRKRYGITRSTFFYTAEGEGGGEMRNEWVRGGILHLCARVRFVVRRVRRARARYGWKKYVRGGASRVDCRS